MTCHICAKTNCIGECEPKIQLDDINVVDMPAQRKPLTKTKVGNYLRGHPNGDVGMYRNGFKDGVAFAEAAHNIKEKNT
jgi:hypothetical protein